MTSHKLSQKARITEERWNMVSLLFSNWIAWYIPVGAIFLAFFIGIFAHLGSRSLRFEGRYYRQLVTPVNCTVIDTFVNCTQHDNHHINITSCYVALEYTVDDKTMIQNTYFSHLFNGTLLNSDFANETVCFYDKNKPEWVDIVPFSDKDTYISIIIGGTIMLIAFIVNSLIGINNVTQYAHVICRDTISPNTMAMIAADFIYYRVLGYSKVTAKVALTPYRFSETATDKEVAKLKNLLLETGYSPFDFMDLFSHIFAESYDYRRHTVELVPSISVKTRDPSLLVLEINPELTGKKLIKEFKKKFGFKRYKEPNNSH